MKPNLISEEMLGINWNVKVTLNNSEVTTIEKLNVRISLFRSVELTFFPFFFLLLLLVDQLPISMPREIIYLGFLFNLYTKCFLKCSMVH